MRSRLLHPGMLFITALVALVLVIPLTRALLSRPHGESLRQVLILRAG